MKTKEKKSFFERLTGTINVQEKDVDEEIINETEAKDASWMEEEGEEGQLTVDVYQTDSDIIIQTMVAGVRPEDLDISITRDMVTIKGKREVANSIPDENYFHRELYWGAFSRTILLPQEIEPDESEATEKHGFLTLRLSKIDKKRQKNLKVKSV
ncbi:MAG: hypothetical protein BMS9Abin13_219 [Patescibacteria group bacterium]|nr:MAG: hypothetical protein BMS9Abin13_219 [Patescibacteria group bacterium]